MAPRLGTTTSNTSIRRLSLRYGLALTVLMRFRFVIQSLLSTYDERGNDNDTLAFVLPLTRRPSNDTDTTRNSTRISNRPSNCSHYQDDEDYEQISRNKLTNWYMEADLGWSEPPPLWVQDLCPQVVNHFNTFPVRTVLSNVPMHCLFLPRQSFLRSFSLWLFSKMLKDYLTTKGMLTVPAGTTFYFAKAVCTLQALASIFRDIPPKESQHSPPQQSTTETSGTKFMLIAGTHLGAIRNGQPIPWDDDIDVIASSDYYTNFTNACDAENGIKIHSNATLKCHKYFKAVKVWVDYDGMKKTAFIGPKRPYKAPFIDIFWYHQVNQTIYQLFPREIESSLAKNKPWRPREKPPYKTHRVEDFFPPQPYYYAGSTFLGPPKGAADRRYKNWRNVCLQGTHSHTKEKEQSQHFARFFNTTKPTLDCCRMAQRFPFRDEYGFLRNQNTTLDPTFAV